MRLKSKPRTLTCILLGVAVLILINGAAFGADKVKLTFWHHEAPSHRVMAFQKAIELDEEILEGPGWLWRFLRNIDEKPPTIKDRAAYLEAELAKPEEERLLSVPELDEKQRMYKIDD